jgi:hypothetical protein
VAPRILEARSRRTLLIAVTSVLLAWLPRVSTSETSWANGVSILAESQVFVIAAVLVARRRWRAALLMLLVSPVHFRFWGGAYRYARGEAYYLNQRHCNKGPLGNLDVDLRVPLICWELRRPPLEWELWGAPQNAAVRLLSAAFGPMPGAYDGPLPTRDDVRAVVRESALAVKLTAVHEGAIPVGDAVIRVRPDFGPRIIEAAMGRSPDDACLSSLAASVALWQDRVLVVAMPWWTECDVARATPKDWVSFAAAVDARSGNVLGYYALDSFPDERADQLAGIWRLETYGSVR